MIKDGNWCQCSAAIKDIVCTKISPACMRRIQQQQPLLLHPIENFPPPARPEFHMFWWLMKRKEEIVILNYAL